ncbi:MAG: acetate--CoA ligase [Bradymonadales bacterium]|nr:MAG: acetate--CoA ligase [Bradymonadales bacterium]
MSKEIESVLQEADCVEVFPDFQKKALYKNQEDFDRDYRESIDRPEVFWARIASELDWNQKWTDVLEWNCPHAKWFVGGQTNIAWNCLGRNIEKGLGEKLALIFESEEAQVEKLTYQELSERVAALAGFLKSLGVKPGDRVGIYLPLRPEAVISMLACASIGAVHSVIFGGFSAQAVRERLNDAKAETVITADGGRRRGKWLDLKSAVDEAAEECPQLRNILVFQFGKENPKIRSGRDHLLTSSLLSKVAPQEPLPLDSEHPLFILYTSGSTGKPKGVLHTTGGYMVGSFLTTKSVFDIRNEDVFWCTADVGWVTGHSYLTYGPLLNAATCLIYEGAPDFPDPSRFWQMIDRHQVSIFYTAPTAIRAFMKWGEQHLESSNRSSLRLLGSVGEPINPEAWKWYFEKVGNSKCPIVDTWWQTETGSIMISTLPGVHKSKPGSAGVPLFGVDAEILNQEGQPVPAGQGGLLVINKPWPSMMRGIFGDEERYKQEYWGRIPNRYFAGDGARQDSDSYFWIMGRIDDVVNVSGHRLGTMEVESALVSHPAVAEAAVVSRPDEIKGEAIVAFVTLDSSQTKSDQLKGEISSHVVKEIGAIARPSEIRFADSLPKTRSGKIMRRLLRSLAAGDTQAQDTSTLEDQSVLEKLRLE